MQNIYIILYKKFGEKTNIFLLYTVISNFNLYVLSFYKKIKFHEKKIFSCNRWSRFCWFNLIKRLLKKTNFTIISIDNYSSGSSKNHITSKKVKYIKGIQRIFSNYLININ